ncbi:DUF3828 domain-containing protein [Rhodospirillaceae bacterium KN72]|uniref:DUF3828 domain-containing protein n=2 Tax=Pacificispira spongiicola TaxID=2729598 RepID=A0A7Y0DXU0_9PROT|nr:DUF3828 domain-containing protein [Pacificispira spongiicola]
MPNIDATLIVAFVTATCVLPTGCASTDESDASAVLQRLYTLPDPDFAAFHDDQRRPAYYSPRIHALALAKTACFQQVFGMDGLDFDYIVPGQDYDIRDLSIETISQSGDAATARVAFVTMGEAVTLDYSLLRVDGRWLIDDTMYDGHSLAGDLAAPCQSD